MRGVVERAGCDAQGERGREGERESESVEEREKKNSCPYSRNPTEEMDLAYPLEPWTLATAGALGVWMVITLLRVRRAP